MTLLDSHDGPTRIVSGAGSLARLPELLRALGGTRALIVTDTGLVSTGHPGRAVDLICASGLEASVFDRVHENPDVHDIDRCVDAARAFGADAFVAVGGGSSIDTAKGAALRCANDGPITRFWHSGLVGEDLAPIVAVPTTAGTGSEVQSYAIVSDPVTHRKMAIGTPKLAPRVALLDPELTRTLPRRITALTGIDALSHAIEAAVSTRASALAREFAAQAYGLIAPALGVVLEAPDDLEARAAMLRGAASAGLAIEYGMLGATHALANPLTARYGVAHGQAVGVMLPHVIRHNGADPSVRERYAILGDPDALADEAESLLQKAGLATTLRALEVPEADLPLLATLAGEQWTAGFNPRPVGVADLEALYRMAW